MLSSIRVFRFVLSCVSIVFVRCASGYPNEPSGFAGYSWGTNQRAMANLKEHQRIGSESQYLSTAEQLDLHGKKADKVLYAFVDDLLEGVDVSFQDAREAESREVMELLLVHYGAPDSKDAFSAYWDGERTDIKIIFGSRDIVVRFLSSAARQERAVDVSDFADRWRAEWHRLLRVHTVADAIRKLDEWLTSEGAGILSGHTISPNGDVITLSYVASETSIEYAQPVEYWNELLRKEPFSVRELSTLLAASPDVLRSKDVYVRGVVTGPTRGLGCAFGSLLVDREDLPRVKGTGGSIGPALDPSEKGAIPAFMTYGAVSPRTHEVVLRGHFFNEGLKVCPEGLRRFVITEQRSDVSR